jgi:hypothetical protein
MNMKMRSMNMKMRSMKRKGEIVGAFVCGLCCSVALEPVAAGGTCGKVTDCDDFDPCTTDMCLDDGRCVNANVCTDAGAHAGADAAVDGGAADADAGTDADADADSDADADGGADADVDGDSGAGADAGGGSDVGGDTRDPAPRAGCACSTSIDSVEDPADPDWERSWTEELRRRSAAADARAVRGSPWPEVRARLLRELAGR